jgi:pimeloyl-ACP methyl ester carboxylesterase
LEETISLPKVKVGDLNIYYEIHGNGFPLVMIVGLGANKDWWEPKQLEEVSRKYKAIIFDNRGTGRTESPAKDFTFKMMADDTVGLMDALKIKKAHVLGVSLGGNVAQEIVLDYPERVVKLVLCSTHCGFGHAKMNPEVIKGLQSAGQQTPAEFVNGAIPLLYPEDFQKANPKYIEESRRRMLIAPTKTDMYMRQLKAGLAFDTFAKLPTIKAPTLCMHGKKDVLIPWENSKIIADRIPGAKLFYLEKSGHALFSVETDKAQKCLFDFLG